MLMLMLLVRSLRLGGGGRRKGGELRGEDFVGEGV